MRRRALAVLFALVTVLALTGCTGAEETPATSMTFEDVLAAAREGGGDAQVEVLEDGAVTSAEFRQSMENYFECLEEAGLTYVDNGANPVDGWRPLTEIGWSGLSDSEGPARDTACSRAHVEYVMLGYELVNDDVMDPALMSSVQACLEAAGVETLGTEKNVDDLLPLGHEDEARASFVETCIFQEGASYPYGIILAY